MLKQKKGGNQITVHKSAHLELNRVFSGIWMVDKIFLEVKKMQEFTFFGTLVALQFTGMVLT